MVFNSPGGSTMQWLLAKLCCGWHYLLISVINLVPVNPVVWNKFPEMSLLVPTTTAGFYLILTDII